MQEENKNDVPMVDIDNSGEDTEVILENPKSEVEVETKEEESRLGRKTALTAVSYTHLRAHET